jgi:hypothetical protein
MRTSFDYFSSNILETKQTTESIISSTSTATNIRLTSFEVTNETTKIEEKTKIIKSTNSPFSIKTSTLEISKTNKDIYKIIIIIEICIIIILLIILAFIVFKYKRRVSKQHGKRLSVTGV